MKKPELNIIKSVAILGGADLKEDSKTYLDVVAMCEKIAKMNLDVYQGGGPGAMKAATVGAKKGGGRSISVTTKIQNGDKVTFEGVDPENKSDFEIFEVDYYERTRGLLLRSDVHIFVLGGTGTLSEFGMSWCVNWLYVGQNKPIILYGAQWKETMKVLEKTFLIEAGEQLLYEIVETPDEVIDLLKGYQRTTTRSLL